MSAKTLKELRERWPGLRFEIRHVPRGDGVRRQFHAYYQGDAVQPVVQEGKHGDEWPLEAEAVVILAGRLEALHKVLTPVGEDLEEDEGDG